MQSLFHVTTKGEEEIDPRALAHAIASLLPEEKYSTQDVAKHIHPVLMKGCAGAS